MQLVGEMWRRLLSLLRRQELDRGLAEEAWRDLRYGVRTLRRTPGFTSVAVLTLALGIGANAAIFSALYGVWLAPAPYPRGERLVDISMKELSGSRYERGASFPDLVDWKAQSTSFEGFGLHQFDHQINVTAGGQAEELVTHRVSANLFPILGVSPVLGRGFSDDEDTSAGPRSVLLGYRYWLRRFAGDPGVLGPGLLPARRAMRVDPVVALGE